MDERSIFMVLPSTNISDLSINDPRLPTPAHSRSSSEKSDNDNTKPYTHQRATIPSQSSQTYQHHQNTPPTSQSPFLNPTILPPTIDDGDIVLSPPPMFKPPPFRPDSPNGSRPVSRIGGPESQGASDSQNNSRSRSRTVSPARLRPSTPNTEPKLRKRRSRATGKSGTETGEDKGGGQNVQSWVITPHDKSQYNLEPLVRFQPVPELWDDNGDTLVFLHNTPSRIGPSFRVNSSCFASSRKLVKAAFGETHSDNGHSREVSGETKYRAVSDVTQMLMPNGPLSPSASQHGSTSDRSSSTGKRSTRDYFDEAPRRKNIHLYLPQALQADLNNPQAQLTGEDHETLLTVRNLFAFLTGRLLVATPRRPSMFDIFMFMSGILHRYEFTNLDGSTVGEEAATNFSRFVEDYRLADVRASREKTLEAIILGERMKSWELYNEGFIHAVGRYDDISALKSPKLYQISDLTRKRLERSNLFLSSRLRDVRDRLTEFDFPGLFAGIANSSTSSESKAVSFKAWRNSFFAMRRHVIGLYKHRYGAWPPKASSKKNDFEESGLNRLLLQQVYQDMCDLYDVLADLSNFTTRQVGLPPDEEPAGPNESGPRALRRVLGEFDRSTTTIQPAIPFDVPLIPSLSSIRRGFDALDPKKQKKESGKKLSDSEINTALMQSYNRDLMKSTPFLQAFFTYERNTAHGKSIEEIADLRYGQWLFMYAVIQSLPLVVVDAPGAKFTQGVEYFLSEFSKESPPWQRQDHRQKTTWRIPGSDTMVDMPAAIVEHSKDAIYQRSHCWQVAQDSAGVTAMVNGAASSQYDDLTHDNEELLPPVKPFDFHGGTPPRTPDRRISMGFGLEQLPLPSSVGVGPTGNRPNSTYDPSKNFNTILGLQDGQGKKKK